LTCTAANTGATSPNSVRLRREAIGPVPRVIPLTDHGVTIDDDGVTLARDRDIGEAAVIRKACR
jgi:hypothetical protein